MQFKLTKVFVQSYSTSGDADDRPSGDAAPDPVPVLTQRQDLPEPPPLTLGELDDMFQF